MNENKNLTARLAEMTADRAQQPAEAPESIENQEPVEQEAAQVDQEPQESAPESTQEASVTAQATTQKESGHFKKLRESLERSEREKEQLYEILLKMQQAQQSVQPTQSPSEPELEDNDFVPRNYVDKRLHQTEQQLAKYQQALYEQTVQNQLQSQYTDFSQVVSKDNISRLREEHPEIAASLAANPDIASKAHAAYKIIKKLGLHTESPEDYEPIKQKIQANSQKPRPAVASPLSYANSYDYQRMSEDDMRREREAMEKAIQG